MGLGDLVEFLYDLAVRLWLLAKVAATLARILLELFRSLEEATTKSSIGRNSLQRYVRRVSQSSARVDIDTYHPFSFAHWDHITLEVP